MPTDGSQGADAGQDRRPDGHHGNSPNGIGHIEDKSLFHHSPSPRSPRSFAARAISSAVTGRVSMSAMGRASPEPPNMRPTMSLSALAMAPSRLISGR